MKKRLRRSTCLLWIALLARPLFAVDTPQETINRYFSSAQEALEAGELDKAESDNREILGLSLDQLGAIYTALAEFEQAERAYIGAYTSSASWASSLVGLASLYLRTQQYDEGIATCSRILEINPVHTAARHVLGKIHFMKGDYEAATNELLNAFQTPGGQKDPSVAYTLALSYMKRKQPEEAAKVFDRVVEVLGDSAPLRILFGRAYRMTSYLPEARLEFEMAIALDSQVRRAHYYLGLTHLLEKDSHGFPEATREFEAELRVDPDSYLANFFLGVIQVTGREDEAAVFHLERAVQKDPNSPDPYLYLGEAYFQQNKLDNAIPHLRKAIELTRDERRNSYQVANAHYMLGRALQKKGDREQALLHLQETQRLKSIKAQADQTSPGTDLQENTQSQGLAGLAMEETRGAILDFEEPDPEARELLLSTAEFYRAAASRACSNLARIMTSHSQLEKTAGYLKEAVFWDETVPDGFHNLGIALFQGGQHAEAVVPLIEALKRGQSPDRSRQLLAYLSRELLTSRQYEAAEQAIDYLLESNPGVPDLHLMKGNVLAQRGMYEKALERYRKLLAASPQFPDAHYFCGTALIRMGNFSDALPEFEAELARDPRHVKALYHKAVVLLALKRPEEAVSVLRTVVRLDPNYADAYYQLGKIQAENGQLLLATANLETAAHLNPTSYIFYQLARTYAKAGRSEDAQRALDAYRQVKQREEDGRLQTP